MEATLLLSFQFLFFPGAQGTLPIGTWASTPHIQVLIHTLCPQHRSIHLPVATVRPAGFYISSMAWPQEDGPLGKSLSIQTLEGMGGNLGRGVQCPWHGKHGPKRKMCELAGCVLMTPRTIAPQKGAQLEESEKEPLVHGSQGKGSSVWIWPVLPLSYIFNFDNLTLHTPWKAK